MLLQAQQCLTELRELRTQINQTSHAVMVSMKSIDLSKSGDGWLLQDHILSEAERLAEMIGRQNDLTRQLYALEEQYHLGLDLNMIAAENEVSAEHLHEIFQLLPHSVAENDESNFIEEFDRLLAEEEQNTKRHQYLQRIRNILMKTQEQRPSKPHRTTSSTSDSFSNNSASSTSSKSSKTARNVAAVTLPIVGGVLGGLIFGPAGMLLGFKGVTYLGAFAAVGAGVGVTTGTGISLSMFKDLPPETVSQDDSKSTTSSSSSSHPNRT